MKIVKDELALANLYTKTKQAAYDWYDFGWSNRFVWRCPTSTLLNYFNRFLSANHLDIGVGSGYYLDHCEFKSSQPRIALVDLDARNLALASKRIQRYQPEAFQRDVLKPLDLDGPAFDSVSLNYLLHCLPGTLEHKAKVFDNVLEYLNPGGVVYGVALLHRGVKRGRLAKQLMAFYNQQHIVTNAKDSLQDLKTALSQRFKHYDLEVEGCVALFHGYKDTGSPLL